MARFRMDVISCAWGITQTRVYNYLVSSTELSLGLISLLLSLIFSLPQWVFLTCSESQYCEVIKDCLWSISI